MTDARGPLAVLDVPPQQDSDKSPRTDQHMSVNSETTTTSAQSPVSKSILRVALVFPSLKSCIPSVDAFAGEAVDFVLFPEAYINSVYEEDVEVLRDLASDLGVPLLVGVTVQTEDKDMQTLYKFSSDGSEPEQLYIKHTTAGIVAFNSNNWSPRESLHTFELGGVQTGATICHDCYLGPLQQYLARNGARLWLNPNGADVVNAKWSPVLRLRAVENGFFVLSTHCHIKRSTHPYAFSPDGRELCARKAGCSDLHQISDCTKPDTVYIVKLDIPSTRTRFDWSNISRSEQYNPNESPKKPVRVSLRNGQPAVHTGRSWNTDVSDGYTTTKHGDVYVGVVNDDDILNASACFRVIYDADNRNCRPIIWNHWDQLPTKEPDRMGILLKGRAIECFAPIVISDKTGIRELVEISNPHKLPVRRPIKVPEDMMPEATVELQYAVGLPSAFKMARECIDPPNRKRVLNAYQTFCHTLSDGVH